MSCEKQRQRQMQHFSHRKVKQENGNDKTPYIIKKIEPQVNGVLVVAEGGDNPEVKKEIIETIQVLFGVELHKIKVMKLK